MATMQEVANFIVKSGGHLQKMEAESFTINYPFQNGRDQILIGILNSDLQMLTVISPFAETSKISAEHVLSLGTLFGVITFGNFYALATTVPLATIDELEVGVILNGMVYLADSYEKRISGGNVF
jgi:hypothetical protein